MKKNDKPVKILMVFTANMNLGDNILADNDYYLIKKAMGSRKCDILCYNIASRDVGQVQYVDAVIFAGGILKSTNEKFWLYIPELIREAEKCGVPVFLSAVGVEQFFPDDEKSVGLKEALNLPCVKGISVRDDIDTLKRDYITNSNIRITSVYDPAVWCRETYREVLQDVQRENIIGLGVVRDGLFADYGNPQIDKGFQLDFWKATVQELESKGLSWKIFTNGDRRDEAFANEVLAYIGHGEKLDTPRDSEALIRMIASFKGIIAGRMHSNIVAYALGIPSIGFVWNQKLDYWGRKIGHPERFLRPEELTAENAAERLEAALKQKVGPTFWQKRGIYQAIKKFARKYCIPRQTAQEMLDYKSAMVAHGLGCMELRYRNTNSVEAYQYSLDHGYVNFQVDLRLTADGVPVCVNRWHRDTYKILNLPLGEDEKPRPLMAKEFEDCRYYNRIATATLDDFLRIAAEGIRSGELRIVVGIGRPSKADRPVMLELLRTALEEYALPAERFLLRLERKTDVEQVRKMQWNIPLMYWLSCPEAGPETAQDACREALALCREYDICHLAMSPETFRPEIAQLCRDAQVMSWVFSYRRTDRIIQALQDGADRVGSNYYDVSYMQRLTGGNE